MVGKEVIFITVFKRTGIHKLFAMILFYFHFFMPLPMGKLARNMKTNLSIHRVVYTKIQRTIVLTKNWTKTIEEGILE